MHRNSRSTTSRIEEGEPVIRKYAWKRPLGKFPPPPPRPGATHKMQRNDAFTSYQKGPDELVIRKYARKRPPKILPENEKVAHSRQIARNRPPLADLGSKKSSIGTPQKRLNSRE